MNLTQMFNEAWADTKTFFTNPGEFWRDSSARNALLGMLLLDLSILLFILMAIWARLDWSGALVFGGPALLSLILALGVLVWQSISGARSYPILGAFVAIVILLVPVFHIVRSAGLPQIHDISTDLRDPPRFVEVKKTRPSHANALDRKAPKGLAKMQRKAYPKVKTARFGNIHKGKVFEAARNVAHQHGWTLVAVAPPLIEATASSLLMGFKDDIVIRVREGKRGKHAKNRVDVDVRSVSRLGRSDLGANARRIEAFITDLKQEVRDIRKAQSKARSKARKKGK